MSLELLKQDTELLLRLSKRYTELLKDSIPKDQLRKIEAYIYSLLQSIERNINENVKGYNKNS